MNVLFIGGPLDASVWDVQTERDTIEVMRAAKPLIGAPLPKDYTAPVTRHWYRRLGIGPEGSDPVSGNVYFTYQGERK